MTITKVAPPQRCPKHVAVPYRDYPLSTKVICTSCGRLGVPSNGRRMIGRPTRIHWFREWDLGAIASDGHGNDWHGQPIQRPA